MHRDPLRAKYQAHKGDAKRRGIPFKLTFKEWLSIWRRSRRINQMGYHSGQYVMSRFGDVGAYEVGNVRITTCNKNAAERRLSAETKAVLARKRAQQWQRVPVEERKQRTAALKAAADAAWDAMSPADQHAKMEHMRKHRHPS